LRSSVRGSRETPKSIVKCMLGVAILILLGISGSSTGWIPFLPAVHAQGVAHVVVNPSSIASLTSVPGSTVTFQIDTADSPPFAGFEVGIFSNVSVLQSPRVDLTGNVLGVDAILASECVNGLGSQCSPTLDLDGQGVVSVELFTSSGANTTTPNGKLFSVTFTVGVTGFSPIHIVESLLGTAPNGNILPVAIHDGYFTNMDCPSSSGNLCRPPIVSFSAPQSADLGDPVAFDVSGSKSQNPNGTITTYAWVFASGADRFFVDTTSPLTTFTFRAQYPSGRWTVTLTVRDNYGTPAIETLPILLIRPLVSATVFLTDSSLKSLPFQTVNVILSGGVVRSVHPRNVLVWANVTNTGPIPLQSLNLIEFIRTNGAVNPSWTIGKGGIHVYYANTTSLATNPEITQPSTIKVSNTPALHVTVAMPSLNATAIGHPLMPGQSLLLSVDLTYALIGTSQSAASYPQYYDCGASVEVWTKAGFMGGEAGAANLARLVALATSVGNSSHHTTIV